MDFTEEELAKEEWRNLPLERYEQFQVSNLGRVKGLDGHILRQFPNNSKNLSVQITNGKTIHRKVDELVALCFIKEYESVKQAQIENGFEGISNACRKNKKYPTKTYQCHGYVWRYA